MTKIRQLSGADLKQSIELSQYAFQFTLTNEEVSERVERQKAQENITIGIFEGEKLASKLTILPLSVYLHGKEFAMGGIAGVATWPEYRRKRYVTSLIKKSLEIMKEQQQLVSYLHPFKISFYRKYGWDLTSSYAQLEIKSQNLTPLPPTDGSIIRVLNKDAFQLLNEMYNAFTTKYTGMMKRSEKWWSDQVYSKEDHFVMYTDSSNQPAGYLRYGMKENILKVEEMVYLHEEARSGLWNFICQHDSMAEKVLIKTAEDDKLHYLLDNPKIERKIVPYFMGRIVDLQPFFQNYHVEMSDPLFLHVKDEHAPWNNGTLHIHDGKVDFYRKETEGSACTHSPKKGIQIDIGTLSAIMIGGISPSFLHGAGKLTGSVNEVNLLEKMISLKTNFFADFF